MSSDLFFVFGLGCFVVGYVAGKFFDKIVDKIKG